MTFLKILVQYGQVWVRWAHEFPSLSIQEINVIFLPKQVQDYPSSEKKYLIKKCVQCFIHSEKLVFYVCTVLLCVQGKYKLLAIRSQDVLGEDPIFLTMHVYANAFSLRSRTFWRCLYKPAASRSLARSSQ